LLLTRCSCTQSVNILFLSGHLICNSANKLVLIVTSTYLPMTQTRSIISASAEVNVVKQSTILLKLSRLQPIVHLIRIGPCRSSARAVAGRFRILKLLQHCLLLLHKKMEPMKINGVSCDVFFTHLTWRHLNLTSPKEKESVRQKVQKIVRRF